MKNIIVFDSTFYIRNRIKELIAHLDVNVIEAESSKKMMSVLQSTTILELIIMEINLPHEDGVGILKNIRKNYPNIPIIILTSESKRSSFIEGIQQGASDYILKPFDDDFLVQRILQHLNHKWVSNYAKSEKKKSHKLSFDFQNFLDKELKKAIKGQYQVTLLMTLYTTVEYKENKDIEKEYLEISNILYPELQKVIFDVDTFTKYGSQSFIGVFPFCSKENRHLIDEKFQTTFDSLKKNTSILHDYILINTFVTFPKDGTNRDEIMETLVSRIYESVDKEKVEIM